MFINKSKFCAYAYECIHNEVAYGVDFVPEDVDPYDFTEQKSEELKSPCVTIELTGDLANSFDLVDLLEWLKERNLFCDTDCDEVAEIYNNSYYAGQDDAIFEALNGTAAMEANPFKAIKDAIARKVASHQMKKGEKTKSTSSIGPIWAKNLDLLKTVLANGTASPAVITPEQVVRYYVDQYGDNIASAPALYCLLQDPTARRAVDLTGADTLNQLQGVQKFDAIAALGYADSTDGDQQNQFKQARAILAQAIMAKVKKAEAGKFEVVGYAVDTDVIDGKKAIDMWKNTPVPKGGKPVIDETKAQTDWSKWTNEQKMAYLEKFMPNTQGKARLAICNYIISAGGPFDEENAKTLLELVNAHDKIGGSQICILAAAALVSKKWLLPLLTKTSVVGLELEKEKTQIDILEAICTVNSELGLNFLKIFMAGTDWLPLDQMKERFDNAEGKDEYCLDYSDGEGGAVKKVSLKQALAIVSGKGSQIFSTPGRKPASVSSRDKFIQQQTVLLKGLDGDAAVNSINQMLRNQKFDLLSSGEEATFRNAIK